MGTHPKALPHAVANSFVNITKRMDAKLTITHPEGYELNLILQMEFALPMIKMKPLKCRFHLCKKLVII